MLVEKSAYEADLSKLQQAVSEEEGKKKKKVRQSSTYPKASKEYVIRHGVRRGGSSGEFDGDILESNVPLDSDSADEGQYSLVQSGTCRRGILTSIYRNKILRKCGGFVQQFN